MQLDWEIWIDMHISPIIAKWLSEETGWIVKSSYTLQFNTVEDLTIYYKAKESGRVILISKDSDFPEIISRLGSPPKLIVINIGNCSNKEMWSFIKSRIYKAVEILNTEQVDIIELE